MLPLAIFYSPPQIEISRRFIRGPGFAPLGGLAPHNGEYFVPKWSEKQPTQLFSSENNLSIYTLYQEILIQTFSYFRTPFY